MIQRSCQSEAASNKDDNIKLTRQAVVFALLGWPAADLAVVVVGQGRNYRQQVHLGLTVLGSMFQNQIRDDAQNRNLKQTHCCAEDHDPIRPNVSDYTGPQHDHGAPGHGYASPDCNQ